MGHPVRGRRGEQFYLIYPDEMEDYQIEDIQHALNERKLGALVDENAGGIIAYVLAGNEDEMAAHLGIPENTEFGYEEVTLTQPGAEDLEFDGIQLAHVSSRKGEAPRWTEFVLYRTSEDNYVLCIYGKSEVPGEVTRGGPEVWDSPTAVKDALRGNLRQHPSRRGHYLTSMAMEVLREAARMDPGFEPLITERV